MPEPFLGGRLEFDIQHELIYDMPGCTVGEQCLPRPIGVHLIFVGSWSKGWGQPQIAGAASAHRIARKVDSAQQRRKGGRILENT